MRPIPPPPSPSCCCSCRRHRSRRPSASHAPPTSRSRSGPRWRRAGRSTYRINGDFWALEHYYPGTNHVTLQLYDGSCMEGTWDYSDPLYCFHWDGQGTSCFRHARLGDEILIIEQQNGADTPMTQSMTAVTDVPLTCGPAQTS